MSGHALTTPHSQLCSPIHRKLESNLSACGQLSLRESPVQVFNCARLGASERGLALHVAAPAESRCSLSLSRVNSWVLFHLTAQRGVILLCHREVHTGFSSLQSANRRMPDCLCDSGKRDAVPDFEDKGVHTLSGHYSRLRDTQRPRWSSSKVTTATHSLYISPPFLLLRNKHKQRNGIALLLNFLCNKH